MRDVLEAAVTILMMGAVPIRPLEEPTTSTVSRVGTPAATAKALLAARNRAIPTAAIARALRASRPCSHVHGFNLYAAQSK